ncbi:MAG: hypothetical protein RR280_06995 [Bacteroidaceae bacterium]
MNNIYSPDQSILEKVQDSVYRIYLLAKREILENQRSNLLSLLAVYAIFMMTFISNLYRMSANYERYTAMYGDANRYSVNDFKNSIGMLTFVTMAAMFFMTAATTFHNKNKGENIAMLSLPAKNYEKFTASFLIRFVLLFLLFYLTINLADLTRLLYQPAHTEAVNHLMINEFYRSAFAEFTEMTRKWGIENIVFICTCLGTLLLQAFCFLGSALWNKQAIKKTIVLFSVMLLIGIKVFNSIVERITEITVPDLWVLAVVLFALTIIIYGFTYRLYKHRTLKERTLVSFG